MFNRGALVGFAVALAEILAFVFVARVFGLGFVVLASLGLALLGMAVLRRRFPALIGSGRDLIGSLSLGDAGFRDAGLRDGARASDAPTSDFDVETARAADRALGALGGVLLIVPGFVTGLLGALLLLPPFRALVRGPARRRFAQFVPPGIGVPFPANGFPSSWRGFTRSDVIDVDVVSEDMPRAAPRELP